MKVIFVTNLISITPNIASYLLLLLIYLCRCSATQPEKSPKLEKPLLVVALPDKIVKECSLLIDS
jgi:hypothetical protein